MELGLLRSQARFGVVSAFEAAHCKSTKCAILHMT